MGDLSDQDLLLRAVPGTNHIAWQVGHLIASEYRFIESLRLGTSPKLPAGFQEKHTKDKASSDDASQFCSKKEYLELFDAQRKATLKALETFSDTDFDKPGPEQLKAFAPTIGSVFLLISTHQALHSGQFVAVRRKAGKAVVM